MKKISALLLLSMFMLLAGGCNKKDNLEGDKVNVTPTPVLGTESTDGSVGPAVPGEGEAPELLVNDVVREEYNFEDYITLGQYEGIEVTVGENVVTESDIRLAIQSELQSNGVELTEVTDRAVQIGDIVNIDYEGLKDGVAFEGGTAQDYNLLVGSGQFIPGFEDQLMGTKTGDKVDLNLTFPETYPSEDLAGQPVVFKVTVNKIQEYVLTEDYIKANTDFTTIDAFMEARTKDVEARKEINIANKKANDIYNNIVENSEISSLPQSILDYFTQDFKVYYSNYAASYGVDLATFLNFSGSSEAQFEQNAKDYAKAMTTREVVMTAIAKAANIVLTEEDYQTAMAEYAVEYGYESTEEFMDTVDEELLRQDILYRKVEDYIVEEAIEL